MLLCTCVDSLINLFSEDDAYPDVIKSLSLSSSLKELNKSLSKMIKTNNIHKFIEKDVNNNVNRILEETVGFSNYLKKLKL